MASPINTTNTPSLADAQAINAVNQLDAQQVPKEVDGDAASAAKAKKGATAQVAKKNDERVAAQKNEGGTAAKIAELRGTDGQAKIVTGEVALAPMAKAASSALEGAAVSPADALKLFARPEMLQLLGTPSNKEMSVPFTRAGLEQQAAFSSVPLPTQIVAQLRSEAKGEAATLKADARADRAAYTHKLLLLVEKSFYKAMQATPAEVAARLPGYATKAFEQALPQLKALLPKLLQGAHGRKDTDVELPPPAIGQLEAALQSPIAQIIGMQTKIGKLDKKQLRDALATLASGGKPASGDAGAIANDILNHGPQASGTQYQSALRPIGEPDFSKMDVDALIQWVMMQSAQTEDDLLRDKMAEVQARNMQKQGMRAQKLAATQAKAAANAQMAREYQAYKQDPGITCSFDDYKAWRQMTWGEGQLTDAGGWNGPPGGLEMPVPPFPAFFTAPAEGVSDSGPTATGEGAPYGLNAEQEEMLKDIYERGGFKDEYDSFEKFLEKEVGVKAPMHDFKDLSANNHKVTEFLDDLAPPETKGSTDVIWDMTKLETMSLDELKAYLTQLFENPEIAAKLDGVLAAPASSYADQIYGLLKNFIEQNTAEATAAALGNPTGANTALKQEALNSLNEVMTALSGFPEAQAPIIAMQESMFKRVAEFYGNNCTGDPGVYVTYTDFDDDAKDVAFSNAMQGWFTRFANEGIMDVSGKILQKGAYPGNIKDLLRKKKEAEAKKDEENPALTANEIADYKETQADYEAYADTLDGLEINGDGQFTGDVSDIPGEYQDFLKSEGLWSREPTAEELQQQANEISAAEERRQDLANRAASGLDAQDPALAMQADQIGTMEQFDAYIEGLDSKLTSISEMGELDTMRLQAMMDRRSKLIEALSNIMKKISQTESGIVDNLK